MVNCVMGQRINGRVRGFFAQGHKSSNKVYAITQDGQVDAVAWPLQPKADFRWDQSDLSGDKRLNSKGMSDYQMAEALVKVPLSDRAGNCGEMAALAAYYVLKSEFMRREHIYVGTIKHPGDHAFCLVSQAPIPTTARQYGSVSDFTKAGVAGGFLIIDPWLNTVCAAKDYLIEGGIKLLKWQQAGKRVSWHAGTQGKGWYPPAGEYKDVFATAPLSLDAF